MLQEDSNGEASFEIIDKKNGDHLNADKTESLSSVSSNYSIPSPSVVNIPTTGNLLSNLPPPSALPDFTLWQNQPTPVPTAVPIVPNLVPPIPTTTQQVQEPNIATTTTMPNIQPFLPTQQFSAAIPPSKGIQHGPAITTTTTDANPNTGGLIGWMKDAVSSGGILQKVAEKAKNSIDSVITTLDPQMTEFIHTGGDLEIIIASQDADEIVPIRDAIYLVFGKARVNNVDVELQEKHQAFGFDEGFKRLEAKIEIALNQQTLPTVAVENILLQQNEKWFTMYILMLNDPGKQIKIHTYSQAVPLPVNQFLLQAKTEMPEYAKGCDSPEKILTAYFHTCKNDWQQPISGVPKKDILQLAARVLTNVYKTKLLPE